ncbi:MAG TPA: hypothetical protein VK607_22060 [Kofleriaceae bacterium]|nr:hypothetical protein [Kofleriaceae bacterium]
MATRSGNGKRGKARRGAGEPGNGDQRSAEHGNGSGNGHAAHRAAAPHDAARRAKLIALGAPTTRPLKAYAFDPSRGTLLGNQMELAVRYQELDRGPVVRDRYARDAIAVIDYDASNDCYYEPVDLDDPRILIRGGLDPVEADPRFHQQMVYAVVTETVQHFEAALGRSIHWRRGAHRQGQASAEDIYTLNIFPHAMVSANAFYSPKAHGILFGYFRATTSDPGNNLPGQIVNTCLSHDIVVHETTHAIIDGIRGHFTDQTNPDVAAFHEAFADLVAMFRHFAYQEVLLDAIQRTGGRLFDPVLAADAGAGAGAAPGDPPPTYVQVELRNPLVELAQQFGEATGRGKGLRSALGEKPDPTALSRVFEPHARGAILVAAVFDAYFQIYVRRTADLFKIYRAGGREVGTDLPVPLARLLAAQASATAELFFTVCVRSLDYCPPIDITFGDFLRAVITSDFDLRPTGDSAVRDAFMQGFRRRGISPDGAAFFTDTAIAWPPAKDYPPIPGLAFGDPNGLTRSEGDEVAAALHAYFDRREIRTAFELDPELPVGVPSFHPVFRIAEDGSLRSEMVIEVIQERSAQFDPSEPGLGAFPVRGGATVIVGKPSLREVRREQAAGRHTPYGNVRYVIGKRLDGAVGAAREARQRAHYQRIGLVEGTDPDRFQIDFAITHGGL